MPRSNRIIRTFAAIVAASVMVAGCASPPPQPDTMRDPQANFSSYKTFGWASPAGGAGAGDPPLGLLDSNIRAAITTEMKKRGYVEAPEGTTPDLRMAYDAAAAEKVESNPVRIGIGIGGYGSNGGGSVGVGSSSTRNVKEGTLVIHAVDSARNAEVWQGRMAKKIPKGNIDPAAIQLAVATAMQDFPAH